MARLLLLLAQLALGWGYLSRVGRVALRLQHGAQGAKQGAAPGRELWPDKLSSRSPRQDDMTPKKHTFLDEATPPALCALAPSRSVMDVKAAFAAAYPQAIAAPHKSFVSDLLVVTSVQMSDPGFQYDSLFAFGLCTQYYTTMKGYGVVAEVDAIFDALVQSVGFSPEKVRSDAQLILLQVSSDSISNDDLLVADHGELAAVFAQVRSNCLFKYCDAWGVGLGRVLELRGIQPTRSAFERWARPLHWIPAMRLSRTWAHFLGDQVRAQAACAGRALHAELLKATTLDVAGR